MNTSKSLAGTFVLYRSSLKHSIRSIWPWIVAVVLLVASSFAAYDNVFATPDDKLNLARTVSANPAFNLIFGSPTNLLTAEGFTAWRSVVLGGFLTGIMASLTVVRLTRAKEDSTEAELIQSNVVGRFSQLIVGVLVAWTASLMLAVIIALVAKVLGGPTTESLLLGLAMLAAGVMFASVTAVASQIGSHARTVTSYALGALGLSYLLRGFADTVSGAEWVADLSPLGWIQKLEVAGANNIWPVWIFVAFTAVTITIAVALNAYRDFAHGIIADKPGLSRAKIAKTVPGLVLKLERSSSITWLAAFAFIGSMFGYMVASVGGAFSSNEGFANLISADVGLNTADFTFEFVRTLFSILGVIAAVYGTQSMLRLYTEEIENRVGPLLAGNIKRSKLFATYCGVSLLGSSLAMIVSSTAVIVVGNINNISLSATDIFVQGLLTIPAVLLLVSIAIATTGLKPMMKGLAWFAIAASFALTLLGPILQLNETILALSPFWHVVNGSSSSFSLMPSVGLLAISAILVVLGFIGFMKRDVERV